MQAHRRRPDSVFSTARYFVGVTPTHLQLALFDSLGDAFGVPCAPKIRLTAGRPSRQYYIDPRENLTRAKGGNSTSESSERIDQKRVQRFNHQQG